MIQRVRFPALLAIACASLFTNFGCHVADQDTSETEMETEVVTLIVGGMTKSLSGAT